MKRGWAIGGAGAVMLALLGWWALVGTDAPAPASGKSPAAARVMTGEQAVQAPAVLVDLFLLPDRNVRAIPGSARIGIGVVEPDAAAAAPAGLEPGVMHAGAERFDELSTPAFWLVPPTQLLADGRVRVGPVRLPRADRYTLQARGEDGLRYYASAFTAHHVPDKVAPMVGAGVRAHVAVNGTHVLLRRTESSAPAAAWQWLQAWAAPALLEAFDEQPLPVKSGQVLAPLAPGPVEIVLEVHGVEAERRRLTLPAGRVTDVHFEPLGQKVAQALSIDLELEFVRQGSGTPVAGLQVIWLSGRMQQTRTTDARGRVAFDGLDRQQVHQFNLAADSAPGELPEWPALRPLEIGPEELDEQPAVDGVARRRVELTPLRWLIARLPPEAMQRIPGRRSPYPIHVLQKEGAGRWTDVAADHFIPVPEGMAVSVAEPGTYRVATTLAPWRVIESEAARVDGADRPRVSFGAVRGRDVILTVMRDGRALPGAPVHIIGPVGHLPPQTLRADASGRVVLADASVSEVRVEVPGSDQVVVPLSGPRVLADFGHRRAD
jgi:hypothetical protein